MYEGLSYKSAAMDPCHTLIRATQVFENCSDYCHLLIVKLKRSNGTVVIYSNKAIILQSILTHLTAKYSNITIRIAIRITANPLYLLKLPVCFEEPKVTILMLNVKLI